MTRVEWIAGSLTLVVAVALSVAVDSAVGFAAGLAAFPLSARVARAVQASGVAPARFSRGRAGAADA